jgi:hypothetical protein
VYLKNLLFIGFSKANLSFLPNHSIKRKTQINPKFIKPSLFPIKAGILKILSENIPQI